MNFKKFLSITTFSILSFSLNQLSAQETETEIQESDSKKSNSEFYITVDAAYYPESEYRTSSAHIAKLTGVYYGLEGRATLHADYTISTPLGTNWLLKDANIKLQSAFEVSPVTIRPMFSVSFTPVPFLSFSAGASIGTGWTLFGWEGMSILDKAVSNAKKAEYNDLTPFKHFYYDYWTQGTFMFDTGAIIPGDWTHFVTAFSFQLCYRGLTGVSNDEIWEWQASDCKANGLQYYSSFILAYQMPKLPKKVYRVGFMTEFEGHFKDSDYVNLGGDYNGNFQTVSISPLIQFKFTKNDSLIVLANVSSRRAFKEEHDETTVEPYLNYIGYEWYFRRVALSYTHIF